MQPVSGGLAIHLSSVAASASEEVPRRVICQTDPSLIDRTTVYTYHSRRATMQQSLLFIL